MARAKPSPACKHVDALTLDRLLLLPGKGSGGKRGPRSLAPVFGLHRRIIAKHARECLRAGGERREKVMDGLWRLAWATDPKFVEAHLAGKVEATGGEGEG